MMFWTNIYALSPHIEALLKKEDVTLHELMDQEEILPECKSQNKKLVDYLSRPDIMQELVTLTTKEPSTDVDERSRYKYPNVACELLTCNVPSLNEKLAGDETLLAKLYSFIDTDVPLNPLLASFFSKTIGVLLTRRSDQVLEFLKSREKCVDRLLQHLETSAIMDLVLKLVTKVEGSDMRQNVLNWLDSQQLVQRLIKLLSPTSEPARHANAALLLCDMIKLARYLRNTCTERTDPDPILNTLESEETVSMLLETILSGVPTESSIVGGIQVLLVLLGHETNNVANEGNIQGNSAGEDTNDDEGRIKIQNATLPYLELFQKLLLNPPRKPPVKTTAGLLKSPLGNTRLHVAKLLVALLYTENIEIFRRLAQLGTFLILLDLFFKYSWNNFLHTQVEQCLASVINGDWQENSEVIYNHIFVECKLINRLLEVWDKNENKQNTEKGVRQGYMGHLINIMNNIVKECAKNQVLDAYLKTHPSPECAKQWEELVTTELVEINKTHELLLGGKPQPYMSGSDDPNDEYNSYGQDAYIQQVYANYQGQQMTPNFIEHCGFHDDEFNDRDDALHNSIDQLTTMPFTLNEEDLDKGEDMFNKICQQKQKTGLDESGGAMEWCDEGELTFQTVIDKRDWPSKQQHHDSNSSDEDEHTRDVNMDIDSKDPWGAAEPLSNNAAPPRVRNDSNSSDEDEDAREASMDIDSSDPWGTAESSSNSAVLPRVNPWDVDPAETVDPTGWANFDNFESALTISGGSKLGNEAPEGQEIGTPVPSSGAPTSSVSPVESSACPVESAVTPVADAAAKPAEDSVGANNKNENVAKVEESVTEIATVKQQSQKVEIIEAAEIAAKANKQPTEEPKVSKAGKAEEESPPKAEIENEQSPPKAQEPQEPSPDAEATPQAPEQPGKVADATIPDDSVKSDESIKVGDPEKQEKPLAML